MHDQPRYKPLAATDFFGDGRSARPEVEGTVARGHLRIDQARYTGKVNSEDVDYFPFPITQSGSGARPGSDSIFTARRVTAALATAMGWWCAADSARRRPITPISLIKAPVGHFFDVITNGFGAMPSYASRVEPDDRWRIAAYIRVLQLSQNAQVDDVPADLRGELDKNAITPKAVEPIPSPAPPANKEPAK